ncbi:16S rRNA (uracil(1498)-N(3))-methyltransferase [uncultured Limosilactobacillus sp.]|uniref:16S rRNA (uracil(1498)-N(3))-methyltransferase n=1 Tax=uncultured Limosilactobacillus sp. TaxID=2837629 RepID=UPI0025DA506D|nr:16S rRNA (uracil(1498)-N(3))-methyltransferase [uncultured Limosilactobacillus sp.]
MQRYFVTNQQPADTVELPADISHHLVDVMRAKVGAKIEIVCADHQAYLATVISLQPAMVRVDQPLNKSVEMPVTVTIACGLPKTKEKPQLIVQKGTELGATRIVFFDCQRSISHWTSPRREKKLARLQKIANGAAEQSHRTVQPRVVYRDSWQDVLTDFPTDTAVVAWEESAKQGEVSRLQATLGKLKAGERLTAFFGPEGGLTSAEINAMNDQGVVSVGLGPRILRTETAPLYFLSAVSYQTELNG